MKAFIILFAASLATFTVAAYQLNDDTKQISEYCIKSSGVEVELLIRARENDFVEDGKLMNYYTCTMKRAGIQNADGTFNVKVLKETIPTHFNQKIGAKVVEECSKTDAVTPDRAAYDVAKCFISTMATKA